MNTELEMITNLRPQFLQLIRTLARSQGFYGRLLRWFESVSKEEQEKFLEQFKDCKTTLDIIYKLEC